MLPAVTRVITRRRETNRKTIDRDQSMREAIARNRRRS